MRANKSQYAFRVSGLDDAGFAVKNFSAKNYGLAKNYCYVIKVTANRLIGSAELINKSAKLIINWDPDDVYIHGIINNWRCSKPDPDRNYFVYQIIMYSSLSVLGKKINSRIFQNQNVFEVIEQILVDVAYQIKTTKQYPKIEYMVQFRETDLEFLERILSQAGLFYAFVQKKNQAILVILDDLKVLPEFPKRVLNYRSGRGHNRTEASIYDFDEWVRQAKDWRRQTYIAETDCRGLQMGQSFVLQDVNYRVINIKVSADQSADFTATYKAKLLLIRASVPYCTRPIENPKFYHILPATIESTGGDYAYLDEQGRYHVRFAFDQSSAPLGSASCPIRAVQPSGEMHFPLHNGTQVAVGFIDGDVNRPVILGVISNAKKPTPVASSNHTQNIVRTFSGHELVMEDLRGQQYILLATQNGDNQIKLNATKDKHCINVQSKKGKIEIHAKKDINIRTGDGYSIKSGNNATALVKNTHRVITQKGEIEHQAGRDILFEAKGNIITQTDTDLNIKSGGDLKLKTDGDFHLISENEIKMQNQEGDLKIYSEQGLIFQGDADMYIGNGEYGITITKAGNLNIKGKTITFKAPQINIYEDLKLQ